MPGEIEPPEHFRRYGDIPAGMAKEPLCSLEVGLPRFGGREYAFRRCLGMRTVGQCGQPHQPRFDPDGGPRCQNCISLIDEAVEARVFLWSEKVHLLRHLAAELFERSALGVGGQIPEARVRSYYEMDVRDVLDDRCEVMQPFELSRVWLWAIRDSAARTCSQYLVFTAQRDECDRGSFADTKDIFAD